MRDIFIKGILVIFGFLVSIVLLEALLRVNAYFEDNVSNGSTNELPVEENDPSLRWHIIPNTPGYDQRGFRNVEALSEVDIVTIGDSLTHGLGVELEDSWPQQLSRLSGLDVYNMAVPGYGPAEYYTLSKTALLEVKTNIVIVALFLGNDLADAENMVYRPESASHYAEFQNFTYDRVSTTDLESVWNRWWDTLEKYRRVEINKQVTPIEQFFQTHSKLYWWLVNRSILRAKTADYDAIEEEAARMWALDHPEDGLFFENNDMKTVLNISFRSAVVDPNNPRIWEGIRLTKTFIEMINDDLKDRGIKLIVIIIPTKELVFAQAVQEIGIHAPGFGKFVDNELQVTQNLLNHCSEKGLFCLQMLDPLREELDKGVEIYPVTTDGHPTPSGYEVIARVLVQKINGLGLQKNQ